MASLLRRTIVAHSMLSHVTGSATNMCRSHTKIQSHRFFSNISRLCQKENLDSEDSNLDADQPSQEDSELILPVVDPETSIRYMQSEAYKTTYKGELVWVPYRRNHKGRKPPIKTRKTCIRGGKMATGNPCPICRDDYLVLHHSNRELLNQFISPYTGHPISFEKTGLCQKTHRTLLVEVVKAWDLGLVKMPLPDKTYDYSQFYNDLSYEREES